MEQEEPFFFPQPCADFGEKHAAAKALFAKAYAELDWGANGLGYLLEFMRKKTFKYSRQD